MAPIESRSDRDPNVLRPQVLSDEILRQALLHSPDGLLICDTDGIIRFVNESVCLMTGYLETELVGHPVEMLVPMPKRDAHVRRRAGYLESPRTRPMGRGLTLTATCSDGSEVAVEISLSPVSSPQGTMTIASIRDIGDRLKDAEYLRSTKELLALSNERERIARDLHDNVLQRLFGLGLELQSMTLGKTTTVDKSKTVDKSELKTQFDAASLEKSVDEIDQIIKEIRTSVFTLGAAQRQGSLGQEVGDILAQSTRLLGFSPRLRIEGALEHLVTGSLRIDLTASLREALGNAARHSSATIVSVEITVRDFLLTMKVSDNGVGFQKDSHLGPGNGVRNLRARATAHGGTCDISTTEGGGALVEWSVPVV